MLWLHQPPTTSEQLLSQHVTDSCVEIPQACLVFFLLIKISLKNVWESFWHCQGHPDTVREILPVSGRAWHRQHGTIVHPHDKSSPNDFVRPAQMHAESKHARRLAANCRCCVAQMLFVSSCPWFFLNNAVANWTVKQCSGHPQNEFAHHLEMMKCKIKQWIKEECKTWHVEGGEISQGSHNLSVSLNNTNAAKILKPTQVEHACSASYICNNWFWHSLRKALTSARYCVIFTFSNPGFLFPLQDCFRRSTSTSKTTADVKTTMTIESKSDKGSDSLSFST